MVEKLSLDSPVDMLYNNIFSHHFALPCA